MNNKPKKIRALGLSSGGLDSILAALILRDQDIAVEWISFETPFFSAANAQKAARACGIPIRVMDITDEYLVMLRNPPCGYGQNMNPCMDCHAFMARIAGDIMGHENFDFIFSGEVAGQRPMSQVRHALRYVEKRSGVDGFLVRPLSARALPETLAEQNGLVDRNRLLDITGRSRKIQMDLAERYGVIDYPSPAGGCLLTDKGFAKRLKDLFVHQADCDRNDLEALKHGRHFRLSPDTKLVVGRNKNDNRHLAGIKATGRITSLKVEKFPGPVCLLMEAPEESALMLAAGICAGYSKAPADDPVNVIADDGLEIRNIPMLPIPPEKVRHLMI